MTDRLTLTRALEGSGMQSAAAERIATEIYDAIHDNVATKADLRELELRLETKFGEVKTELLRWMFAQTFVILAVVATLHFMK
jgi:2-phosphoglycerate kinase